MGEKIMQHLGYKLRYYWHWLKASNGKGHGTHSPFVYSFITEVLNDDRNFYAFADIEKLFYQQQLRSHLPKKYNELLFRMVNYYGCKNMLQIGEKGKLQAAYLAAANKKASFIYIDEDEAIFNETIQNLSTSTPKFDLIFLGENSTKQIHLPQLKKIIQLANPNCAIVVEGNHKRESSKEYWLELLNVNKVFVSVDLFYMGICFFNPSFKQTQQFSIKY